MSVTSRPTVAPGWALMLVGWTSQIGATPVVKADEAGSPSCVPVSPRATTFQKYCVQRASVPAGAVYWLAVRPVCVTMGEPKLGSSSTVRS